METHASDSGERRVNIHHVCHENLTIELEKLKLLLAHVGHSTKVRVEHASQDCLSERGVPAQVMFLYEEINKNKLENGHHLEATKLSTEVNNCLAIQGVMAKSYLAIQALALIIYHPKQNDFERILCFGASFWSLSSNMERTLFVTALQQLEILKHNFGLES
ncbi:DNA mismatch repair protein MSH3 [Forsythia ovata]|uniref:DNA mismatch repair protein MSH3 n=1 Tax=Forsythia ovata TaxID=205694 RepID=A0ABD1UBY9_9LAMI